MVHPELLALSVFFFVVLIHPFILYPLTLKYFRQKPLKPVAKGADSSATLVFCCYNERASIEAKLNNLRKIRQVVPQIKFACYDDNSNDGTLEVLLRNSDLLTVHASHERTGKALGMAKLVRSSDTDVMIFTDANVLVEPEGVAALIQYFSSSEIGGVCGHLIYVNGDETTTARTSSAYWNLEEALKEAESRVGSTMGADGSIFAIRREHYPVVPGHLLDDLIVSMSVVFAGLRLISARDVVAYERAATQTKDEARRRRRIACRAFSSHLHIWPQISAMPIIEKYKYISHRVLRWFSFVWLSLSALMFFLWSIANFGSSAMLIILAAAAAAYFGAAAKLPIFGAISEVVGTFWATLLGVIDSLSGRTYQQWQPPISRNDDAPATLEALTNHESQPAPLAR